MDTQTLKIGRRKFVLVPEREFRRLQKRAGEITTRPEFGEAAMRELRAFRRTGKANDWKQLKHRLGL